MLTHNEPSLALVTDNSDNFVAATLAASINGLIGAFNGSEPQLPRTSEVARLEVVELYPYVPGPSKRCSRDRC